DDVTYLTLRQWPKGSDPAVSGVEVVAVGPRMALYTNGRRRIVPPIVFGAGVFLHLLRRGKRYDVVHTSSFPYFSLLAAASLHGAYRWRLFVDWLEIWTRDYWRGNLRPPVARGSGRPTPGAPRRASRLLALSA